jgi:hypothetical protein
MLHDDRNRIGFVVKQSEQILLAHLLHRPIGQLFVVAEQFERVFEIRCGELQRHEASLRRLKPTTAQRCYFGGA